MIRLSDFRIFPVPDRFRNRQTVLFHEKCKKNRSENEPFFVCGTVSSMLSGLKTRSLGLNTLGTQCNLQPRHSLSKSVVRPPLPGFNQ